MCSLSQVLEPFAPWSHELASDINNSGNDAEVFIKQLKGDCLKMRGILTWNKIYSSVDKTQTDEILFSRLTHSLLNKTIIIQAKAHNVTAITGYIRFSNSRKI